MSAVDPPFAGLPGIESEAVDLHLYTASRAIAGLYRPFLDVHGITYTQYLALRIIWTRDRITVRDLGCALDLDSGTLSPLLKRLENRGLIRRQRGTQDERTVWVTATTNGHEVRERTADLPSQVTRALEFTLAESRQLHALLAKITRSSQ